MPRSSDGSVESSAGPQLAIERAREALNALSSKTSKENRVGLLATGTVVVIELVALAALCLHTFIESGAPKVDSTSVALLAVILIAPFVSKLKALELGGAKAEWQEGATAGLKEILEVLDTQHRAISQVYDELSLLVPPTEPLPIPSSENNALPKRRLQHLMWVDDHPENNAYEVGSLSQFMQVTTVTSNDAAFRLLNTGVIDAIISDIGRDSDPPDAKPGGIQLIDALAQRPEFNLPVLYYTSQRSVDMYGAYLQEHGAIVVTQIFSELLSALRGYDEQLTVSTITAIVEQFGGIVQREPGERQVDLIVMLASRRIGIEIASWTKRSQWAVFASRANRLEDARRANKIDTGWIVVDESALDHQRSGWVAEHKIELVTITELPQRLKSLTASRP